MNINNQAKINIDELFISLINCSIDKKASDIHIEPLIDYYQSRIRINGELIISKTFSKEIIGNTISQLKILANLDITETRIPQDGKINYYYKNNQFNLRLSTCPTIMGEKLVIRILDNQEKLLKLEQLGLEKSDLKILKETLTKCKSGLILFSGSTGSGKTTSLYASLNYLDYKKYNIITVEDPVEITFQNINQINVNQKINLTFPIILKAILRQDPDIIIIGEIRDLETAKIAVNAAKTGHLVLATIHSNSATCAINRLLEIGLPNHTIKSCIELIVFQKFNEVENLNDKFKKPIFELKKIYS